MKRIYLPVLISGILLLLSACGSKKESETRNSHKAWIESFQDSISNYKKLISENDEKLSECNLKINELLENFEYISNPKMVEGYYIVKGWNSKLPFTSTAVYARINEGESLEVIATLAGGVFDKITVSDSNSEASSGVVPNDQALNYRHSGYTTVCFSGEGAENIAKFIAENKHRELKLSFLEYSTKKQYVIPESQKEMIATTWNLFEIQKRQKEYQKMLWYYSRKIDTFVRMTENNNITDKN